MKYLFLIISVIFIIPNTYSKEYKSLNDFKVKTNQKGLTKSDWLLKDRKLNTKIWKEANYYNLSNNLPLEYTTINQHKDFYYWYQQEISIKRHEVVWPSIAVFVSSKLGLMEKFPINVLTNSKIINYSKKGSSIIFNNVFRELFMLLNQKHIIKGEEALKWDAELLYKEQVELLQSMYETIDKESLKKLEHLVQRKGLNALFISKKLKYEDDISNPIQRYNYALQKLRPYCQERYLIK